MITIRILDSSVCKFVLLTINQRPRKMENTAHYMLYSYLREKSYEKFIEFR
jgi:hypothetical protein